MKSVICALVSGGLDSCVMLGLLAKSYRQVYPLFIRQGLVWETAEIRALHRFLKATKTPRVQQSTILDLPIRSLYGKHWSVTGRHTPNARTRDAAVYLPGRNLLLFSLAAVFCVQRRIPTIAIGSLGHNPFADATPHFLKSAAATVSEALHHRLQIIAPLRNLTKAEVICRGANLPLHVSFSCLAPWRGRHCGRCNKCAERQRAFRKAGCEDRTRYTNGGS